MLAVPRVHIFYNGRDQDKLLQLMGCQQVEQPGDAKTGKAERGRETTGAYLSRMQGYMMFYGPLSQSEQQGDP